MFPGGCDIISAIAPATIIGTDNKNEYSEASCLSSPENMAAEMVVPLLDSPGITATPCDKPTIAARIHGLHFFARSLSESTKSTAVKVKNKGKSLPSCILSAASRRSRATGAVATVEISSKNVVFCSGFFKRDKTFLR